MATLDDIQTEIAADFDSSATAPASTNSEYARRLVLINRAVRLWATERNGRWPELATTTSLSTTANQAYVTLPSDCGIGCIDLSEAGEIEINAIKYKMVNFDQRKSYTSTSRILWVTVNEGGAGYRLNIQPTPTSVVAFNLDYYSNKLATSTGGTSQEKLSISTDITKCPDMQYIVFYTLGQLYKDDDEGAKGVDFGNQAIDRLNMMLARAQVGEFNQNAEIPFFAERSGYKPLGL